VQRQEETPGRQRESSRWRKWLPASREAAEISPVIIPSIVAAFGKYACNIYERGGRERGRERERDEPQAGLAESINKVERG